MGYTEIRWLSRFDGTGYGIWGRRTVEAIQSSIEFMVGAGCPYILPKDDPLAILQQLKLENPISIYNYIPTFPLKEGEGWCTCTELRRPPENQIYNMNNSKFVLALGDWCANVYKECLDEPEKVFPINFPLPARLYGVKGRKVKFQLDDYKFKFLFVGRIDVRKNIPPLIEAFKTEFGKNKDVCLLLKLTGEERLCVPKWLMRKNLSKNIFWVPDRVETMSELLRGVNAYVCTDFGEGWGAPCTEAMLCGVPTIMPNHSGHLNYGNKGNSWLIDVGDWEKIGYDKENTYPDLLPPHAEVKFPKEDSIRKNMAEVYETFKDVERENYQYNNKVIEALKVERIVNYKYVLEQFKTAFKYIKEV